MSTMKNFIKPSRRNSSSELEMRACNSSKSWRRRAPGGAIPSIPRDESLYSNIAVTEAVRAGMGS